MSFAPRRSDIERFLGPNALPEWVDAFARLSPGLCEHYAFTRLRWVHFMGQIAAETSGLSLKRMEENMRYTSASRIQQIFSYRLGLALKTPEYSRFKTKAALAQFLVNKPVELAKVTYSNREGTPPGKGHLYIGRGPMQTTHLNNYRAAGDEVARQPGGEKFDLVANPDMLSTDCELGVRVAFAEWHLKRLSIWADRDDCDTVSDVLNTGNPNDNVKPHGLNERRRWTAKAKVIWPHDGASAPEIAASEAPVASDGALRRGDKGDEVLNLQKRLHELGYHPGAQDGIYGLLTERAVKLFQSEHGLAVDGIAGPKTLEAMENSAPANLGERETVTAKELKRRGSKTTWWTQLIKSILKFFGLGTGGTVALDSWADAGLVDKGVSALEWVQGIGQRSSSVLAFFLSAQGLVVGGIALACVGLYFAVHKIEQARVEDAKTGAHLGK